ncbi:unnamed protein product, partial [marine sediment metagenome]
KDPNGEIRYQHKYLQPTLIFFDYMALEDLFGSSSLTRTLDFLLENRFWDYTKTDIANHIGISRQSLYNKWSILEKYEIVISSRKIGSATLYKTNLDSPIVKALSELSLKIAAPRYVKDQNEGA